MCAGGAGRRGAVRGCGAEPGRSALAALRSHETELRMNVALAERQAGRRRPSSRPSPPPAQARAAAAAQAAPEAEFAALKTKVGQLEQNLGRVVDIVNADHEIIKKHEQTLKRHFPND